MRIKSVSYGLTGNLGFDLFAEGTLTAICTDIKRVVTRVQTYIKSESDEVTSIGGQKEERKG